MTTKQAFAFAFLYRCAEEGLAPAQIQARINSGLEKRAVLGEIGSLVRGGGALVRHGLALPLGIGIVGGGLTGIIGGHALGKMHEDPQTHEDIRRQEIIAAYNSFADRAERNAKIKQLRAQLPIRSMGGGMRVV